jgi:hypothetical protein
MNDILLFKISQYNSFMNDHQGILVILLLNVNIVEQICGIKKKLGKSKHTSNPKVTMCCGKGKVQLPLLKTPPKLLQELLFNNDSSDSKKFQQHIKTYVPVSLAQLVGTMHNLCRGMGSNP